MVTKASTVRQATATCARCGRVAHGTEEADSLFSKGRHTATGYQAWCKQCVKDARKPQVVGAAHVAPTPPRPARPRRAPAPSLPSIPEVPNEPRVNAAGPEGDEVLNLLDFAIEKALAEQRRAIQLEADLDNAMSSWQETQSLLEAAQLELTAAQSRITSLEDQLRRAAPDLKTIKIPDNLKEKAALLGR